MSTDYRKTLNLPRTDFPMKANLTSLEPKILSLWKENRLYEKLSKERQSAPRFILHDGPPYANGKIHIGHALNKILKDIVLRHKTMAGFNCPFIVGWDCHGLPVEHQLLKELKLSKHNVDVADFRQKAHDYALKFVDLQRQDFIRLGVLAQWDKPYLTLDYGYEYRVLSLLSSLVKEKYIFRGLKPVNWCYSCETALAEAEVEYRDKESDSIYVFFRVAEGKEILPQGDIDFLIWTTTPWTLVANTAVCLHPEFTYGIFEYGSRKVLMLKERAKDLLEGKNYKIIKEIKGKELEGILLKHPFINRNAQVVLGEFVSSEEGSGCVHIAPGHGQEDFLIGKKYNLEIIMPVDEKGRFHPDIEFVGGMNVYKANEHIINLLDEKKSLFKAEKITHSYPHCWRCKKPIIFRATNQWFLNIDHNGLRDKILKVLDSINWVPSSGYERMKAMISSRPEWCISRQRLWGVPIPALKCRQCKEVILNPQVIDTVAEKVKEQGSAIWFNKPVEEFLGGFKCLHCGGSEFDKETDILDVWFESGASFFSVVETDPQLSYPADMYLEGSDQHRGWFQASLILSFAKEESPCFKTVLTHGFVVDGEGKKMSKSQGNVISPQEFINKFGVEILRLWVAFNDYQDDLRLSGEIIKQLTDLYRKVRNTLRFIMGNLYDFSPAKNVEKDDLLEVDRFMATKAVEVYELAYNYYEKFQFYKAIQLIFDFCNLDLSSFYLDILKDRLYVEDKDSLSRRSAQTVLYLILELLLKMISPVLVFTAEEAYQFFPGQDKKESAHLLLWEVDKYRSFAGKDILKRWEKIFSLRKETLKNIEDLRAKGKIGSSLEAEVKIYVPESDYKFYLSFKEVLKEVLIVSKVEIVSGGTLRVEIKKSCAKKCGRCWHYDESVGKDNNYPELCARCAKILNNNQPVN